MLIDDSGEEILSCKANTTTVKYSSFLVYRVIFMSLTEIPSSGCVHLTLLRGTATDGSRICSSITEVSGNRLAGSTFASNYFL